MCLCKNAKYFSGSQIWTFAQVGSLKKAEIKYNLCELQYECSDQKVLVQKGVLSKNNRVAKLSKRMQGMV